MVNLIKYDNKNNILNKYYINIDKILFFKKKRNMVKGFLEKTTIEKINFISD